MVKAQAPMPKPGGKAKSDGDKSAATEGTEQPAKVASKESSAAAKKPESSEHHRKRAKDDSKKASGKEASEAAKKAEASQPAAKRAKDDSKSKEAIDRKEPSEAAKDGPSQPAQEKAKDNSRNLLGAGHPHDKKEQKTQPDSANAMATEPKLIEVKTEEDPDEKQTKLGDDKAKPKPNSKRTGRDDPDGAVSSEPSTSSKPIEKEINLTPKEPDFPPPSHI